MATRKKEHKVAPVQGVLTEAQQKNFMTLRRAFAKGDAAMVNCLEVATGKEVALICAMGRDGNEIVMTPFAVMIDGNPFELYRPPNPDGGWHPPGE